MPRKSTPQKGSKVTETVTEKGQSREELMKLSTSHLNDENSEITLRVKHGPNKDGKNGILIGFGELELLEDPTEDSLWIDHNQFMDLGGYSPSTAAQELGAFPILRKNSVRLGGNEEYSNSAGSVSVVPKTIILRSAVEEFLDARGAARKRQEITSFKSEDAKAKKLEALRRQLAKLSDLPVSADSDDDDDSDDEE